MRLKRIISNEEGSVTIEFIGILPLFFLIMLICWQFLIGVYGVIVAQSAANEAAKVYAITQNEGDALAAAEHVLHSAGGGVGYNSGESYVKGPDSDGYFTVTVGANLDIVFLPDFIRDNMDESDRVITFERNITSRVVR